jgi:hypothetical protein
VTADGFMTLPKTPKNVSFAPVLGVKDVSNCYVDLVRNGHYALDLGLFSGISQSRGTAS